MPLLSPLSLVNHHTTVVLSQLIRILFNPLRLSKAHWTLPLIALSLLSQLVATQQLQNSFLIPLNVYWRQPLHLFEFATPVFLQSFYLMREHKDHLWLKLWLHSWKQTPVVLKVCQFHPLVDQQLSRTLLSWLILCLKPMWATSVSPL